MFRELPTFYNYETLEYDRKSRLDDPLMTVEEVLEKHGRMMDEYANRHLGGPIPEENKFKEIGSGESIDSRPEMLRLLKAVENPRIKAILVVDVQRLSRGDLEDAGRLIKILRYTNTYVITPYKIYDLRDEYDRDAFERELKKGNEYLEYFKKIQRRGTIDSVAAGNYVGSVAPFGFDRLPIKDGKKDCFTLIENKERADIVRLIFEWYCNEDIGVTAICRRLESMNIKTNSGGTKWRPSIIFAMLENVHYIGYVRWNWRKTVKIIEDQQVKETRPKAKVDEYLIYKGKHKGIISEELFQRAQEIRGTRHRATDTSTLKNPLSGVLYCKCGAKMGYNTYVNNGIEIAPPKLKCNDQVHCKSGSADFNEVFDAICRSLEDCIEDFKVRIDDKRDDSIKLHKNLIATLKKKMDELQTTEDLQWESLHHPDPVQRMPQPVFNRLNEKVLKEKEAVREALCKAEASMPEPVDYKEKILTFTDALNALRDPNISAKIKNRYLKDIVERIDYERAPNVRITKENAARYGTTTSKGMKFHQEPFKISITIKS
jgi:hypothetical protein